MKLITLDQVSLSQITDCFNLAFSDYFVPFKVTEDYLQNRWHGAAVDYSLSAGVLDGDLLVGFIVKGVREWGGLKTAFNVGTGVIPSHRGNALSEKMYAFLFPKFVANNIKCLGLEVIQENAGAIHVYKKVGLKIHRNLNCYNGNVLLEIPKLKKFLF